MIVSVTRGGEITLLAADELTALHVETVDDVTTTELAEHLEAAGAGRGIGAPDEVGLDIAWLKGCVLTALGSDATTRFDVMVAYAAGRGWVSADGSTLHAHRAPPVTTGSNTASADNFDERTSP